MLNPQTSSKDIQHGHPADGGYWAHLAQGDDVRDSDVEEISVHMPQPESLEACQSRFRQARFILE